MSAEENLQLLKTLDDSWNAQNWEVFRKRHTAATRTSADVASFGISSPSFRLPAASRIGRVRLAVSQLDRSLIWVVIAMLIMSVIAYGFIIWIAHHP